MAGPLFERSEYTTEEISGWTETERAYAEGLWSEFEGVGAPVLEEGEFTAAEMRSWTSAERAYTEGAWAAQTGISGQPDLTIEVKVTGVESLAKSFETLSARAHKNLIPNVLAQSVNRLNDAIVKNIPVGPRGHEGDTGGWRNAQSRMRPGIVPTSGRHTTTVAAALPDNVDLGIRAGDDYYPFDVEYGSRIVAALAPIRRAVERLERSEFGMIGDLFGHGLAPLAIVIGPALLLRKVIFGRSTPKDLMPIDFSRSRPGDIL